jgi:hypothetical protein
MRMAITASWPLWTLLFSMTAGLAAAGDSLGTGHPVLLRVYSDYA